MTTYLDYAALAPATAEDGFDPMSFLYYPAAVVTDLGVSIANSFLWEDAEIDTYEILGAASADLAEFYIENEDAVQMGSFVAGLALPFGSTKLVSQLMQYAASGKPSRILTPIRYMDKKLEASKSKAIQIATEMGVEDKAYKQAMNTVRMQAFAKQGLENAAWELNALALLNGHPFMEDYDMTDFGWSMAIGGALAPLGILGEARQVKLAIADIEAQAAARVKEYVTPTIEGQGISRGAVAGVLAKQMMKQEEALLTPDIPLQDRTAIESFQVHTKRELYDSVVSLLDAEATKKLKEVGIKQAITDFTAARDRGHDPAEALAAILRENPAALDGIEKRSISLNDYDKLPWEGIEATDDLQASLMKLDDRLASPSEYAEVVWQTDKLDSLVDAAVIDTWTGKPVMMDAVTARTSLTPANIANWTPTPNIMLGTGKSSYELDRSVFATDADFLNNLKQAATYNKTILTSGKIQVAEGAIEELTALRARALELQLNDGLDIKYGDRTLRNLDELTKALISGKRERLTQLLEAKPDLDNIQLAKLINASLEFVKDFRVSAGKLPSEYPVRSAIMYNSTKVDDYLNTLQLRLANTEGAAKAKYKELDLGAELDRRTLEKIRRQAVAATVDKFNNEVISKLYTEIIDHPGMKQLIDSPEKLLSKVSQGRVAISSADMALRNLGDDASIIISLGRNLETISSEFVKTKIESLQPLMREFQTSPGERAFWYKLERQFANMDGATAADYRWVPEEGVFKNGKGEVLKWADNKQPIRVPEGKLRNFITAYKKTTDEILSITNAVRDLRGDAPLKPLGLWVPRPPVDESFIAYVIDDSSKTTKQIIGTSKEDMEAKLAAARKAIAGDPNLRLITYAESEDWNRIHRHASIGQLDRFNSELGRKGIGFENIPSDMSGFDTLLRSLSDEARNRIGQFVSAGASPLFDTLDEFRRLQHQVEASAGSRVRSTKKASIYMADVVKKTLLNQSMQTDTPIIKMWDNAFTEMLTYTLQKGDRLKEKFKQLLNRENTPDEEFAKLAEEAKALGFKLDWQTPAEYAMARGNKSEASAKAFIGRTNALHALFALRLGEVSHAIVTALSAPIVMSAELKSIGAPQKIMMEAVKLAGSNKPADVDVMKYGKQMGYSTRQVAEYNEFMAGLVAEPSKIDKLTNDGYKVIEWLTKPSDVTESWVREVAYAAGYLIAKDKLPQGTSERLLAVHANGFVNRVMGNYTTKQRPTIFQGAGGAMIGLYKTFVLTYGQNLVRYVEQGQKAAILTLMGAQSAMFGTTSLPGYSAFNEVLGAHVSSSDHTDITQSVYKAFGDDQEQARSLAEFILYGIPSTVFQTALSTRAEINPISPISFSRGAAQLEPPAISALMDAAKMGWDTAMQVGRTVSGEGTIGDIGRAITQGLSTQYLSRPVARISELVQGYSIDRKGETIQEIGSPLEEPWAYISRVFGARPMEDQVLRQLRYQNSYYNFVDTTRKRKAIQDLRLVLRGGGSEASIAEIMQRYLDANGTYRGWNQVLQRAYLSIGPDYAQRFADKYNTQEGIADIVESYAY